MADLDRDELLAGWEGEHGNPGKERIKWVQEHAAALDEHTNVGERVPASKDHETREWLDRYKGTVTRQLRDGDGESGKADADEGGE